MTFPRNRQITTEALRENARARDALEKLTQKLGVDGEKLLALLRSIPFASNKPLRLVEGMEDRRVRKLHDRIRNWADTIEKLNSSPWLTPDFLREHVKHVRNPGMYPKPLDKILTVDDAETTAKLFRSLPGNLRLYADVLDARIQFFHRTGRRRQEIGFRRKPLRLQTLLTLRLLALVRASAQRPCLREITTLLDTAFAVAGKPLPRFVGEENLSKLEKGNPWITWILREFPDSD